MLMRCWVVLLVWGACYNDVIYDNLGVKTIIFFWYYVVGVGFLLPIKNKSDTLPSGGVSRIIMENLQQLEKLEERKELRWGDNKK